MSSRPSRPGDRPPVEYLHNLQRQQIFSQRKLAPREYLILPESTSFPAHFWPARFKRSTPGSEVAAITLASRSIAFPSHALFRPIRSCKCVKSVQICFTNVNFICKLLAFFPSQGLLMHHRILWTCYVHAWKNPSQPLFKDHNELNECQTK